MAETRLGPLERRVMHALWQRDDAARVRDLQPEFPDIAYTTLMTTLDRLHRKGLLDRVPVGRAFAYRPRVSHEQMHTDAAVGALRGLVAGGGDIEPVLSFLVDEVSNLDEQALDALERLIRQRRRAVERSGV
jgi:predicted transcriptional regulator